MTIPALPPLYDVAELEIASRCIFHFRGDDQSLTPLTSQVPTFSRAATATVTDINNVSFTCAQHMPAWEPRDWDNDTVREQMGVLLGTSDRLSYAAAYRPGALAFWHEFIQVGAVPASGIALWSITNDAVSGARLIVDSSGSFWRVVHHNGSTSVNATLAAAPANGDRVVLWGYLYLDGSVQLWQSINGAAATNTARSSANSLASAWGTGAVLRIGASGTGNYSAQWLKRLRLPPGFPDYATLSRQF
jgi:hypothetical protein